jgi:ankyrin repeat protein
MIHGAAYYNAVSVTDYILTNGADVNQRGLDNKTALHYTVTNASVGALTVLLIHNADNTLTRSTGETPLLTVKNNLSTIDSKRGSDSTPYNLLSFLLASLFAKRART